MKNGQSVAVFSVDNLKIRVDEQNGTRGIISEIGGKVLLRSETDVARYNALAERTATGIARIGYDSVSYNDNSDYKKNWSIIFTEATWELLNEWLKENKRTHEGMGEVRLMGRCF